MAQEKNSFSKASNKMDSITVSYFHRKRRTDANYSIEGLFERVRFDLRFSIQSRVHVCPFLSNGVLRRFANIAIARFQQSDVNHVTGDVNFVAIGLDRNRTILTNHDCGFLASAKGLRRAILRWLWLQWPINHCRFVTTVSETAKFDLLRHARVDPDKIHVIYNSIDPIFVPTPGKVPGEMVKILQIGTAVNKNIGRLAQALAGLPVQLVVVGKLDKETSDALATNRIRYEQKARLSDAEMFALYQDSDIVAFASTLEGFGLPIIESQTVGRAVVTSKVSSMPEVAGDGACFVDPFDIGSIRSGFQRVIYDAAYRDDLVRRGFINVKRFDRETTASKYLELYKKIKFGC